MYPDEFNVDIDYEPKVNDFKLLEKLSNCHFHRSIGRDPNARKNT